MERKVVPEAAPVPKKELKPIEKKPESTTAPKAVKPPVKPEKKPEGLQKEQKEKTEQQIVR